MEEQIKAGDVVVLKGGDDIKMTVESIDDDEVTCVWFLAGQVEREDINVAALKKVSFSQ